MVRFEAEGGVDPLLRVQLDRGDSVATESNAMVMMDASLSLKGKTRGGFLKSMARKFLNDETFFQQWIEATDGPGEALLAPALPGDIRILPVGERRWMIADGCFLASTGGVEISTRMQGLGRALLSDSGGFFIMEASGEGQLVVSGFGSVREIEVRPDRPVLIDNGHLVAWDASLDYEITLRTSRSGVLGRLVGSQLSGEGFVLRFTGSGKIVVSSRNQGGFIDWIFSRRPIDKAEKEA
ncbi:TIGR00266 family protein [Sutterella sp.]|uniref:TIGR00266 family protein n=1 Tax=Sutterella sp. TaxID=1981025 RepID=UPI0026E027B6|nr:TIGR00266 family protein [Sutterella sp.]MDO5532286.1 TIGR00266 family protein [Sutterella sp.]